MKERLLMNQMPKTLKENEKFLIEYVNFINTRPERSLKERDGSKWEVHHIVPKSFGGVDNEYNLIKLELKEHYTAHLFLYKAYIGTNVSRHMVRAFWNMTNERGEKMSKEEYAILRKSFIESISGENNFNYGKSIYDLKSLDTIINAVEKRKETIKNWSSFKKEQYSKTRSKIAKTSNKNRVGYKKKTKKKEEKKVEKLKVFHYCEKNEKLNKHTSVHTVKVDGKMCAPIYCKNNGKTYNSLRHFREAEKNYKYLEYEYVYTNGEKIVDDAVSVKNENSTLSKSIRNKHSFKNIGVLNGNAKPVYVKQTKQVFGSVRECIRDMNIKIDLFKYIKNNKDFNGLTFEYISKEEYFELL